MCRVIPESTLSTYLPYLLPLLLQLALLCAHAVLHGYFLSSGATHNNEFRSSSSSVSLTMLFHQNNLEMSKTREFALISRTKKLTNIHMCSNPLIMYVHFLMFAIDTSTRKTSLFFIQQNDLRNNEKIYDKSHDSCSTSVIDF